MFRYKINPCEGCAETVFAFLDSNLAEKFRVNRDMSPTSVTATNLRLEGTRLLVARSAFVILSLAAVIFFSLGIPLYHRELIDDISPEKFETLRSLGMSVAFYASYQTALVILLAIGCCVAGIIIFRFKSDDWVAMVVAFTLIGLGTNAFSPLWLANRVIGSKLIVHFVMAMILASHPLTCYVLPDGKFPQKWMRYASWFWFLWLMLSVFWETFPLNLFNWEGNGFTVYLFSLLAALLSGIYALIYRYTHTDDPVKREQLKWVVFSIAVAVVIAVGSNIFINFFERTNPSAGSKLIVDLITQTFSVLAQLSVPTAMVFSILRYRLYDIELVINRSIVYGSLTLILAIVFAVILYSLQGVYTAITHRRNPPTSAIVVSTIVVSGIFQPTRKRLRRFVNRKIYGMDVDIDEMKRRTHRLEQMAHQPAHHVTSVGGYTGLELIARGGMGEIYKARHPSLNRVVAIKILSSYLKDDTDLNKRFAREARTMAQLRHPNIITIHDFGEQDGLPYIVMEYLTGETLADVLKSHGRIPLEEGLPLLQDLASALDYAHAQGVIHRDIKPSNVIVEPVTTSKSARTQRAILMDFGIARFIAENTMITVTGDMLGTADYISPEQVHDSDNVDHRTDIYSFGVLTYQLLTGKKPFERNNTWAMIRSHLEEPPPDARDVVPSLPESAAKAIIKAMAKRSEDRFASAGEFVREIGRA